MLCAKFGRDLWTLTLALSAWTIRGLAHKSTKLCYRTRLDHKLNTNNTQRLWTGIQNITGYKQTIASIVTDDVTLSDRLNEIYGRFDRDTPEAGTCAITPVVSAPPFVIQSSDLERILLCLNLRKAPGLDAISPRLLRTCASHPSPVLTGTFNT